MSFKDTGLRDFYNRFCILPIKPNEELLKGVMGDLINENETNSILCYGYYDMERGITLEVLSVGSINDENACFENLPAGERIIVRADLVANEDIILLNDEEENFVNTYGEKLNMIRSYVPSKEVECTREMTFLDECRHDQYMDDIMVHIMKEGLDTEICWATIVGLGEGYIVGNLLNEPFQDFGCHINDKIAIQVAEIDDNHIICVSNIQDSK